MSDNLDLQNIKNKLDAKFRNISIHDVVDNNDGSVSLVLSGGAENLSSALKVAGSGEYRSLPVIDIEDIRKLGQKMRQQLQYVETYLVVIIWIYLRSLLFYPLSHKNSIKERWSIIRHKISMVLQ